MKCGHPMCGRGIGLLSHRRWFDRKLYCSRACRDNYAPRPRHPLEPEASEGFLAQLFNFPNTHTKPVPVPAVVRVRAR